MGDSEDNRQVAKKHFIEAVGIVFERVGMPRMAGRILGFLLISNPPYQSAEELADMLQASKGSISTMTRLLIQDGLIERVGFPGNRLDYFQMKSDIWSQLLLGKMSQVTYLHRLAERGLDLVNNEPIGIQQRLLDMHDLYAFIEGEIPTLLERWRRERVKV